MMEIIKEISKLLIPQVWQDEQVFMMDVMRIVFINQVLNV